MSSKTEYREPTIPMPGEWCGDPVGAIEIGERLGVEARSVHMMGRRGKLPRPDYDSINNARAWEWTTILWWAGETSRLRTPALLAEYRTTFGHAPLAATTHSRQAGVIERTDDYDGVPSVPGSS